MGRVKIPMAYRTDDRARRVTLCKRKKGLYKKAEELAKLCGVEVSVVIVGDSCKPSQLVATGHANYTDLPSTYRVLTRYSELVAGFGDLNTPPEIAQAIPTMENKEKELEKQRRVIEQLRNELAQFNPNSSLLVEKEQSEGGEDDEDMEEDEPAARAALPSAPQGMVVPTATQAEQEEEDNNAGLNELVGAANATKLRTSLSSEMIVANHDGGAVISQPSGLMDDLNQLARQQSEDIKGTELGRTASNLPARDISLQRINSEDFS